MYNWEVGKAVTQKVLAIVGPTAVGKSALAVALAQEFAGQVISGDSMQVYQGLDIGTAKVTPQEMQGVPHYLIDTNQVDERFSVADFVQQSRKYIGQIAAQAQLPIIAGGTGFYLQALFDNFQLGTDDYDASEKERKQWQQFLHIHGPKALWDRLAQVDPQAAAKIPVGNSRRVIRALEVYQKTGKLFSAQQDQVSGEFDPLIIGLNAERSLVYDRINQRVDQMVAAGLVDEARWLYERGGLSLPAGRGIGYKELYPYFAGEISLDEAVMTIKKNSRHYAKRQLTWFRNKMNVKWFNIVEHPAELAEIRQLINKWLKE